MLRRRTLRSCAWVALYAFLAGWMLPFFEAHPLGFDDDAACAPQFISGDLAPTQLKSADPGNAPPSHCVLCHLMRALNGSVTPDVPQFAAPVATVALRPATANAASSSAPSSASSRGPPAALSI